MSVSAGQFYQAPWPFLGVSTSSRMLHHSVLNINSGGFCKWGYPGKLCHVVTSLPTPAHFRNIYDQLCFMTWNSLKQKKFSICTCWLKGKRKKVVSDYHIADYKTIKGSLWPLLWHWFFSQVSNFCHLSYVRRFFHCYLYDQPFRFIHFGPVIMWYPIVSCKHSPWICGWKLLL